MSTTGAILLAFLAFLVGYFSRRPVPLNQGQQLEGVKHQLDNIEQTLERLDERTYELTLPPFEQDRLRDKRRFDSGRVLTLDDVKKWKPQHTVDLMTMSYSYPFNDPFFDEFEYRHEHMKGNEAHGFIRQPDDGRLDWDSFHFIVGSTQCQTLLGEGEVRRVY